MKNIFFMFALYTFSVLFAQKINFAVVSDVEVGKPNATAILDSIVTSINQNDSIQFVILPGNITRRGLETEFEKAKEILDKLNKKYFILPGNTDLQWSPGGGTYFNYLWGEDKFSFAYQNNLFIGLNTAVLYGDQTGHVKPEDLGWLEEILESNQGKDFIVFTHHPLETSFTNGYKLANLLKKYGVKAVISGHNLKNKSYSFLEVPGLICREALKNIYPDWGYTIVHNDSLKLSTYNANGQSDPVKNYEILKENFLGTAQTDSTGIYAHSAEIIWEINSNETVIAEPLIYDNKIITASYSGIITCYDSTGSILWDYNLYGNIAAKPTVINGIVAVGTLQGDLVTLDLMNGSQIQSIGFDESITSQLISFKYEGNADLMTAEPGKPVYAVAFGTSSGKFYCYHIGTLEEIWINDNTRALVNGKPLLIGNRMIFSSWDNFIYCIDSRDGIMLWKYSQDKDFKNSPANCFPVSNGKAVFFTAPDGYLTALDLRLGSRLWRNNKYNAWESLGISNDGRKLFVKASDGKFHIVDSRNGNWVRETNPKLGEDKLKSQIFEMNDIVPFSAKNGNVYRVNSKYYYKKVLFIGDADMHSTQVFDNDILFTSNIDGHLVMFKIK